MRLRREKNLKFHQLSREAREKFGVFLAFYKDLKGKLGKLLHKNKNTPSTFRISDLEKNTPPLSLFEKVRFGP